MLLDYLIAIAGIMVCLLGWVGISSLKDRQKGLSSNACGGCHSADYCTNRKNGV